MIERSRDGRTVVLERIGDSFTVAVRDEYRLVEYSDVMELTEDELRWLAILAAPAVLPRREATAGPSAPGATVRA
jgi:hypothetical protein